jgi:hypothetical protein
MLGWLKWIFNFHEQKKRILNIILLSFVISFFIVRIASTTISPVIFIKGFHIHHFYFGMLIMSIGAVMGVLSRSPRPEQIASGLIGIGLGLFADEIGLLLNCTTPNRECQYAFPGSYDILLMIVSVIILTTIIVGLLDKRDSS